MEITITNPVWLFLPLVTLAVALSATIFFAKPISRYVVKLVLDDAVAKLLTDKYTQNMAELLPSLKRYSVICRGVNIRFSKLRVCLGEPSGRDIAFPL